MIKDEGLSDPQTTHTITEAIIFVSRANLRPIIRQELKTKGINQIFNSESLEDCVETLVRHNRALLIIDFEHGSEVVNSILRAARGSFHIDTRPIFLLSVDVTREVVAVGSEYGVARIHTGEISKSTITSHINALCKEEAATSGLRDDLTKVADARSRDDWQIAGSLLSDLHEKFPDNRRITCELANNFIQEERWDEAQTILEQITVTDATNIRAQHLLARCHMNAGRFENASEILKMSKLLNPFGLERLIDFGNALLQIDLVKEALENFDAALDIDDSNSNARIGRGQCILLEGDINEALSFLREMSNPRELAAAFNNAAILSIHQGRFSQGFTLYQTAIGAIGPYDQMRSRLMFNLGLARLKMEHWQEAIDNFAKAISVDPSFDKAAHNLRILNARMKNGELTSGNIPDDIESEGLDVTANQEIDDDFSDDFDEESIAS